MPRPKRSPDDVTGNVPSLTHNRADQRIRSRLDVVARSISGILVLTKLSFSEVNTMFFLKVCRCDTWKPDQELFSTPGAYKPELQAKTNRTMACSFIL